MSRLACRHPIVKPHSLFDSFPFSLFYHFGKVPLWWVFLCLNLFRFIFSTTSVPLFQGTTLGRFRQFSGRRKNADTTLVQLGCSKTQKREPTQPSRFSENLSFCLFLTYWSNAWAGLQKPCRGAPRRGPFHQNLRFAWFCTGASRSSKFAKTLEIPASFKRLWYIFWTSLVHLPFIFSTSFKGDLPF